MKIQGLKHLLLCPQKTGTSTDHLAEPRLHQILLWKLQPGDSDVTRPAHALKLCPAVAQKGENERRWPTIWLPRGGSSAGLSGGWRGFALDQVSLSRNTANIIRMISCLPPSNTMSTAVAECSLVSLQACPGQHRCLQATSPVQALPTQAACCSRGKTSILLV